MEEIRKDMRDIRRNFDFGTLNENDIPPNPFDLLRVWLKEAIDQNVKDANAFVLSSSVNDQASSRVVLLRDITDNAIHFFTNYKSHKARELEQNNKASVNIFWSELDRQIRMKVVAEKLNSQQSDAYFNVRPRASQIGAWASEQSNELSSRSLLEERVKEKEIEFKGGDVPRPDFWGGYALIPSYFEFWQGRTSRLHDRLTYSKESNGWQIKRLFP